MSETILPKAVLEAIQSELFRIMNEETEKAQKRIEERLKEAAAQIAIRMCEFASVEPYGKNEVRIILKFGDQK